MFNGSIPIVLDSLKQHYFIDRDGKMFRYILNYLRSSRLLLPDSFNEFEALYDEAKYYDLAGLVREIEITRDQRRAYKMVKAGSPVHLPITGNNGTTIKVEPSGEEHCECVAVHVSPDLGERICLTADRALVEEVFPELNAALMDSRCSGFNMDNRYVIRFPVNGYCKLNSLQVLQRLMCQGFHLVGATGGGVEGQQFSEYILCKKIRIR
jgi:hypothetical protein